MYNYKPSNVKEPDPDFRKNIFWVNFCQKMAKNIASIEGATLGKRWLHLGKLKRGQSGLQTGLKSEKNGLFMMMNHLQRFLKR